MTGFTLPFLIFWLCVVATSLLLGWRLERKEDLKPLFQRLMKMEDEARLNDHAD